MAIGTRGENLQERHAGNFRAATGHANGSPEPLRQVGEGETFRKN